MSGGKNGFYVSSQIKPKPRYNIYDEKYGYSLFSVIAIASKVCACVYRYLFWVRKLILFSYLYQKCWFIIHLCVFFCRMDGKYCCQGYKLDLAQNKCIRMWVSFLNTFNNFEQHDISFFQLLYKNVSYCMSNLFYFNNHIYQ